MRRNGKRRAGQQRHVVRRKKTRKGGPLIALAVAGTAGYLVGVWHVAGIAGLRNTDLSPSQNVALRFVDADNVADNETLDREGPNNDGPATTASLTASAPAAVLGDADLALLRPEPMVPYRAPAQAMVAAPAAPARVATRIRERIAAVASTAEAKIVAAVAPPREAREGFVLNDAQIAGIKRRLRLSPDQQEMWPAVEAALRNIAYAKQRSGHRDIASTDPDSPEVQGLKSAAIPLVLSFSEEQRSEVRNLAHAMGLDQLASSF
jgi:hypothetical protein